MIKYGHLQLLTLNVLPLVCFFDKCWSFFASIAVTRIQLFWCSSLKCDFLLPDDKVNMFFLSDGLLFLVQLAVWLCFHMLIFDPWCVNVYPNILSPSQLMRWHVFMRLLMSSGINQIIRQSKKSVSCRLKTSWHFCDNRFRRLFQNLFSSFVKVIFGN